MEARRMGKIMKSSLLSSLEALEKAGIATPDAIITGTTYGCLENSEKLLVQLKEEGEEMLKPTYFMQSTHNTIGSNIAIKTHCHGYNITYTQGEDSLDWAIRDAKMLLASGKAKTVLVGCHDEKHPAIKPVKNTEWRKGLAFHPFYSDGIIMWRVIFLAITQSMLLAAGQVCLKFALQKMHPFGWTRDFWLSLLLNWQFACCGLFFGAASLLWMYIVKHFPLSVAYPMVSITYIFGMLAAILFFHEQVSVWKWLGIGFIMIGCCLIAK